jgi:hypothetical protein
MKKRVWVTVILGIIAIAVLILAVNTYMKSVSQPAAANNTCTSDSDCVKQQISCCSCTMGGVEECMTNAKAAEKQAELAKCQKGLVCIAMYACQDFTCGCNKGTCQKA